MAKKKEPGFWKLVEAHRGDEEYDLDGLQGALESMSSDEIMAFQEWIYERLHESYRGDLWGAAYLINGGCSDDGFDYFRLWLISRGRKVYDAALADPESLVKEVGDGEVEYEDLITVASAAWRKKTGKDDFYDRLDAQQKKKKKEKEKDEDDLDLSWSKDGDGVPARLKKLFPKLFKKFG